MADKYSPRDDICGRVGARGHQLIARGRVPTVEVKGGGVAAPAKRQMLGLQLFNSEHESPPIHLFLHIIASASHVHPFSAAVFMTPSSNYVLQLVLVATPSILRLWCGMHLSLSPEHRLTRVTWLVAGSRCRSLRDFTLCWLWCRPSGLRVYVVCS